MLDSTKKRRRPISLFVLAMMSTAVVVGLEGMPEVGSFGLPLVIYYAIFTLVFFLPVGLVAAELGVGWPHDGGVYRWIREALGERWAFVGVWCQWLQILIWYPTVLAVCAVSFAYAIDPDLKNTGVFMVCIMLAVFWSATLFNFRGLHFSGWVTTSLLYVGTLLPVALAIALAAWWIGSGHESAIPLSWGEMVPKLDSMGEIVGITAIFSFLSGLEVNAVHFRHVERPQRSIPLSLLFSGLLVLGISILGALSVAVLVPIKEIDLAAGTLQVFSYVLDPLGVGWIVKVLAILALAGMAGHIMVWVIGPTESLRVAADDGLIPPVFQRTTAGGAPRNVMLLQAIIVSLLSLLMLFFDINRVFYMLTIASAQVYLVMYLLMFISVIVLRYTKADVPRSFVIPGGRVGLWLVAGGGGVAALAGILVMFCPPSTEDMSMKGSFFTITLLLSFIVFMGLPLLLFQFRNPNWGRDARMPGTDETTSAWKRVD
ncbi:MAG: amino acid permease [Phycisphaerales bacterium]|jgi:amino acid transporter|nr:amino acid permease [Phycisphaerales bacterium]